MRSSLSLQRKRYVCTWSLWCFLRFIVEWQWGGGGDTSSYCKIQRRTLLQLLYFPWRNSFSTTLRYYPPPFFVFAPKQLDTIYSPHASYAVAVGSVIGRRGGSRSGVAPGDLRDRPGCQTSLSTPISGGLSWRWRYGEPGGVGNRRLVPAWQIVDLAPQCR